MAKNEQTWRIRVQLWRFAHKGDGIMEADTHPDWADNAPLDDSERHKGITVVLAAVSRMIHTFHGAPLETISGALMSELTRRIGTIRTYMSMHNGRTTIQIPYTPDGNVEWRAFVTIQRDEWTPAALPGGEPERPTLRVATQ